LTVSTTKHWSEARPWHTNAALLLIGIALFCLSRQYVQESHTFWIGFSGVSSSMAVLYLAASWLVLSQPVDRLTLPLILIVAVACNVVTVLAPPFSSTDIYRYVWDGIVQHAHVNPYRYVPGDPALAFLRAPNQQVYDKINRRDYARTIYPPAAQALFYLITGVSPTARCMKAAMVVFEAVTAWGLIAILRGIGHRAEQVLLYVWCPMLMWEFGGSGHVDAIAIGFITLALLARLKARPVLTALFLGLAVITKLYPLVLLPGLYRRGDWKMPATVAAVVAVGYACYASAGMLIFSFYGGYAKEEGIESGARYFLLEQAQRLPGLHGLTTGAFGGFCGVVFALIAVWAWKTASDESRALQPVRPFSFTRSDFLSGRASFLAPTFALAAALMFLFSPHYAWYIGWLVPFYALEPSLPMAVYLMGFFYGYTTWLADPGPKMFLLNQRLYAATLLAFVLHMAWKAWTPYRENFLATRFVSTPGAPRFEAAIPIVNDPTPEPTR
jgi:alpha-1,6-mannosyltransferase